MGHQRTVDARGDAHLGERRAGAEAQQRGVGVEVDELGLGEEVIVNVDVTAKGTIPIRDNVAIHAAASASDIIVGPDTVPPGRTLPTPTGMRRRTPPSVTTSTA